MGADHCLGYDKRRQRRGQRGTDSAEVIPGHGVVATDDAHVLKPAQRILSLLRAPVSDCRINVITMSDLCCVSRLSLQPWIPD